MSTPSKRARENKKARKKRDKLERRWEKRHEGPNEIPVMTSAEAMGDMSMTVEEILETMGGGGGGGGGSAPANTIPTKLFVGGLSYDTTDQSLKAAFGEHAPVLEAVVITDYDTGRSRGFGFVTLASHKDAPRVISAMDGKDLDGRNIAVNVATDRR